MTRRWRPTLIIFPAMLLLILLAGIVLTQHSATGQGGVGSRTVPTEGTPFDGTLLGIHFAPTDALVSEGFQKRTLNEICPDGRFNVANGTPYLPQPPHNVPAGATIADSPFQDTAEPDPFALLCPSTGKLYRAALTYTIPASNGPPAEINVLRVVDPPAHFETTASASQIQTVTIRERPSVLIDTTTPAGFGLPAEPNLTLVFPEKDGYLALVSHRVSRSEFMRVAESLDLETAEVTE